MFTNPNEVAKPSIFLPSGGFKPADRRAASRFSLRLGRQKMCPVSCRCRCTWPQVTPRKPCRAVPGRSLWSLVIYGLWRWNQIQISQIREKMGKTKSECCESIMKVLRHKLPLPSSPGASMLIRAYRGSARFTASSLRCLCSASLPLQYWHSIDTVLTQLTQYCYHWGHLPSISKSQNGHGILHVVSKLPLAEERFCSSPAAAAPGSSQPIPSMLSPPQGKNLSWNFNCCKLLLIFC